MPAEIYLVKVGMTMHEGTVEEWYVADGERVDAGALLYRLETEKVNLDVDAETAGVVKQLAAEGATLEPGDVVGYIYADGEAIPDVLPAPQPNRDIDATALRSPRDSAGAESQTLAIDATASRAPPDSASAKSQTLRIDATALRSPPTTKGSAPPERPKGRIAASPVARKLAAELDVDLATVAGTGPRGRITKEDVQQAHDATAVRSPHDSALAKSQILDTDATAKGSDARNADAPQAQPLSAMRRTIAQRMQASLRDSAQLTMDMEVAMDDAVKLRQDLIAEWESDGIRATYTDLVLVAAAKALARHPAMNAAWAGDAVARFNAVHIGLAVALDEGLIVPVVHNAQAKTLRQIAVESAALADRARAGALSLADVEGGTFTVTSLGMYGVDTFTPILNPPQAGILGVGRIYDGLRWDGETPVRSARMRLSLTWDHRVLDGAPAAEFLAAVRDYLEAPFRLLV